MFDFFRGTVTPKDWMFVVSVLAIAGLLCVAFYFLVYSKQMDELLEVQGRLERTQKDLAEAEKIAAQIDELRKEYQQMTELVTLFEQRLPDRREIPALLNRFESIGNQWGLRLELTSLPTRSDTSKETIPHRVTVWGGFHQIAAFINHLEKEQRYFKISDIDIGEQEMGVSEAVFTLSTFRFISTVTEGAR